MHIVVAGGTGFIGRPLCASLAQAGHRVTLLTRRKEEAQRLFSSAVTAVEWNGTETGAWEQSLEGADAVINLAGAPIADARWTDARKRLLTLSRVLTTRLLVVAISRRSSKPRTLINASGIGYYGACDDHILDEGAARGQGFLADLCLTWESEALRAAEFGVRVVMLRTGMVLEQDGGALPKMLLPFRLFAGGPILPGTQWVSWIHRRDHIGLIQWLLATPSISGPVNAVAPEAVRMNRFCEVLGQTLHRPSWLPVPGFALHLALGELGTLMTTGQRVHPAKGLSGGYVFQYPTLEPALRAIFAKA
ncbi:MAG: TIGR01777 family oxidoreductase [Nitrospirota bacterium]|nr:TIGR01777 family oxidoreductase [Nitrospirota bacterium]MDP2384041.1 TIGR01777 family oxidoreductase [Nitrospirota bacterium]MDP3597249.1 TIGR01777 family oxidoreductase [Nitrospirota bacterium]